MPKILFAAPEIEPVHSTAETLRQDGHEVLCAADAAAALKLMGTDEYDLVIIAWELPDGAGSELCRRYRRLDGTAPVLLVVPNAPINDADEGFRAGADYICLLGNPREIADRVATLLKRTQKHQKVSIDKAPVVGDKFDEYLLTDKIAEGGMGYVFKATHAEMAGKALAMKILKHGRKRDESIVKRFRREARVMSILNHPNLVQIIDFNSEGAYPYLVMEFVEGESLCKIIAAEKRLSSTRATPIFRQICAAVQALHSHGIVHRDLKPDNIMLVPDKQGVEKAKLIDLGIVKTSSEQLRLTATGEILGSPLYMSPEQVLAKPLDLRSDVYSLGCLMYETITGFVPFGGKSFGDLAEGHCNKTATPMRKISPECDVSADLETIIMKCLSKKPEERYQSMPELLAALPDVEGEKSWLRSQGGKAGIAAKFLDAIKKKT